MLGALLFIVGRINKHQMAKLFLLKASGSWVVGLSLAHILTHWTDSDCYPPARFFCLNPLTGPVVEVASVMLYVGHTQA